MAPPIKAPQLLELLPGGVLPQDVKERIIGYGDSGVGKTRWGLSLTPRFGKIAYYAADKNTHLLASISLAKRSRILVVNPVSEDPTASFMAFCMRDWKKVDPEIGTLVIDTYTKVAMDAMTFSANSGSMDREKHFIIGTPGEGGIAIPNRGDYQAVDALSKNFLDMLFEKQPNMHIIFLMHEDVKVAPDGVTVRGGPSHPGRTMATFLPGQFSTVIRLVKDMHLPKGAERPVETVIAIGEHDGKFVAKVRTNDEEAPNKMARVICNRNPINWFEQYDATLDLSPKE
jgi:AAA domain